jgi:CubicO group peptidase (beta-lactamase class C family)
MGHIGPRDSLAIVRPISENTAQWPAGFLFASAPELARFAIAMMQDGQIDGRQAFPAAAVRRATTGLVPHPGGSDLDSARYAMGLVVGRAKMGGQYERVWTHGGSINGYNASLTMVPDRKLAPIDAIQRAAFAAIGATRAPVPPPATRALTAAELALHRGIYAMARTSLEITDLDGIAVLRQGAATMPLTIAADGSLVARPTDGAPVRLFTRLEDGAITYVYTGSRALARQASSR